MAAKLIEEADFPVVYVSGAGLNNGAAGYPDIGMLTLTEMAQLSGYIARATNLPTIADVDTGFGEAMNVFRTVQLYEQEGLAGVHLEDQVFPKRCGHIAGKAVIDQEAMVQKVKAAVAAKTDPNFMVIARVDSKAIHGYDDALTRARAYLDAGADMIFPEALNTPDEFKTFSTDLRNSHPNSYLLANMTEFGKTPIINLSDFNEWGYNIVIYPMTLFRLMMHNVRTSLAELKATGSQTNLIEKMTPRSELYEVLNYQQYADFDATLNTEAPKNIHTT
jgi:methylisocitrate lyase